MSVYKIAGFDTSPLELDQEEYRNYRSASDLNLLVIKGGKITSIQPELP